LRTKRPGVRVPLGAQEKPISKEVGIFVGQRVSGIQKSGMHSKLRWFFEKDAGNFAIQYSKSTAISCDDAEFD
jgi:hypothetical protein